MKEKILINKLLARPITELAYYFKKKFNKNIPHCYFDNQIQIAMCSNCESKDKSLFLTSCAPDFSINILPNHLVKKIYLRSLGKCLNCNLMQDYNRLTLNELRDYSDNKFSKDNFVKEEVWHTYPMPEIEEKRLFKRCFQKRLLKWEKKLIIKSNPKKILFLRPTMGFVIDFFVKKFDAEIYYLDISDVSSLTIKKKFKNIKLLKGNINWIYYGDFTSMDDTFDLIISNHHLLHNFSIKNSLEILYKILKKNGQIIFQDEINIKYWNPFHYNFWNEIQFINILKKKFSEVTKISDCGYDGDYFVTNYTEHGDNPDFICYK